MNKRMDSPSELTAGESAHLTKKDYGYVAPDGSRHFPIYDASHVRNALARLDQSQYGHLARKKVLEAAHRFGIDVDEQLAKKNAKKSKRLDETVH